MIREAKMKGACQLLPGGSPVGTEKFKRKMKVNSLHNEWKRCIEGYFSFCGKVNKICVYPS